MLDFEEVPDILRFPHSTENMSDKKLFRSLAVVCFPLELSACSLLTSGRKQEKEEAET